MNFEFDNDKSEANKKKHGISFIEAQILWKDPDRIEIPAKTIDEPRFVVIGRISMINTGQVSSLIAVRTSELYPFVGPERRKSDYMKAKDLDKKFDNGEDITESLDISKARRPGQARKRVNVGEKEGQRRFPDLDH